MKFKDVFKLLRMQNELTQKEIAEELHIPQSTVAKFESGKLETDFKTLISIAEFFNVTTDYLLGRNT